MKRLAFFLLLLFAASAARAQDMSVASMTQASMDLSAAVYPRADLNGVACALVKVVMPEGAKFEGSIIQPVEYNTGEYWVYVTAGTKQIRVKHSAAGPLQIVFADYGIPRLESKTTYTLDITMPVGTAAVAAPSANPVGASAVPFSLCAVEPDGNVVFFTTDEWQKLARPKQRQYKKRGVVLSENGDSFIVGLEDVNAGKEMQWGVAMRHDLPTYGQAEIIAANIDELNSAMEIFGGTGMRNGYWTGTELDSSSAWTVNVSSGYVYNVAKSNTYRVRIVAPIDAVFE